ncbi:hypothetical protein [Spirosoma linguale]|uniref:Uncharacterized protein n=1 Tax=Spirosoma linguale (strain ATCC 33905 / DSM 74 / LMG 10896 / Claus 1) TaxID=504472 RepID=D2QUF2_SPILD|nr:hypothetical protein Slin_6477 [Spirosoma linguale DSM 74]
MKRSILTTPLTKLRPVFVNVGENIKRYEQVRGLFLDNQQRIFAEPMIGGVKRDQISWYSDVAGGHSPLSSFTPDERQRLIPHLDEQISHLFRDIIRYARKNTGEYDRTQYLHLRKSVESLLEVPSDEFILVFGSIDNPQFVLTNWGFTYDDDKAPRGIIREIPGVKFGTTALTLEGKYTGSNLPSAHEPLFISVENRQLSIVTDGYGTAQLSHIPYLSELTVWQTDANGEITNRQPVYIDERDPAQPYLIWLTRLPFSITFQVINQRGTPVPNHKVQLNYQGLSVLATSDATGHLVRQDVFYGEAVQCYDAQAPNTPLVKTHTFTRNQTDYPIPVVLPDPMAPVKKGLGCMGLLLLLLLFLIAGGIAYYFFVKKEKPVWDEDALSQIDKKPYPLEKAHCSDERNGMSYQNAQGASVVTTEYDMTTEKGAFLFDYYTDAWPDKIEIFDSPAKDVKKDSKPIFSYYGSTIKDSQSLNNLSKKLSYGKRYVTVRVTGQTVWSYKVNCPAR